MASTDPNGAGSLDLRSDTVTKPTKAMREVMAAAVVGDDVFGEDASVRALEDRIAELLGKEAALFFPSATMSNLAAGMAHCHEGSHNEVVVGMKSHMAMYEVGNLSTVGRIFCRQVPMSADGKMMLDELAGSMEAPDVHCSSPKLICVENTNCFFGGRVLDLPYLDAVRKIADDKQTPQRGYPVALHCDGARLWHAATAASANPAKYGMSPGVTVEAALRAHAAPCDSLSVCLSKGLGAPVGSVLAGNAAFVGRARSIRKMLGGGMRQAGIIAAGGLYAVNNHLHRLQQDHERAAHVAASIGAQEPRISVVASETNMCLFRCDQSDGRLQHKASDVIALCAAGGVHLSYMTSNVVRLVAHLGVSETADYDRAVDTIVGAFRKLLG
jgi:threonine aldolase